MTVARYRGPLLALSFALAVISALPVLALVAFYWAPRAVGSSGPSIILYLISGPILWLALAIGLLIKFRNRALIALFGLPFVLAPITIAGFVLMAYVAGPTQGYHPHLTSELLN